MNFSFGPFYLCSIKYYSAVYHYKFAFVFLQICRYVHEQQGVQNILFLLHRKYQMLQCWNACVMVEMEQVQVGPKVEMDMMQPMSCFTCQHLCCREGVNKVSVPVNGVSVRLQSTITRFRHTFSCMA